MELENIFKNKPYKIGIALSGGGIKGLCHAGVLKALEEMGIKPDILSGVSAGAVVGALYADGYSPDEIATLFEDISFRQMTKFRIPDGGIFRIDAFEDFIFKNLRAKTFEELKIPLRIVATNLDKGISVVFDKGNLIDPVVASCSVPVLFTPKKINGVYYVDGGVLKNFPVSTIHDDCEKGNWDQCQSVGCRRVQIISHECGFTHLSFHVQSQHIARQRIVRLIN